jgi:hypothetical protein
MQDGTLERLEITNWDGPFARGMATMLESGKVLFAPDLKFELAAARIAFFRPVALTETQKT